MITERLLRAEGFEIDWTVTGRDGLDGTWYGTIDAIGRMSIGGECRGTCCFGETKQELFADMLREAREQARLLEPCADPECEFHDPR